MMIDVQFNDKMLKVFKENNAQEKSKNHVTGKKENKQKVFVFMQVGNNILLLWDSLQEK